MREEKKVKKNSARILKSSDYNEWRLKRQKSEKQIHFTLKIKTKRKNITLRIRIYIHIYFPNDSSVLFAVLFCFVVLGFEHRAFLFSTTTTTTIASEIKNHTTLFKVLFFFDWRQIFTMLLHYTTTDINSVCVWVWMFVFLCNNKIIKLSGLSS